MWKLRIRCCNWGWVCKTQNMFKNWSGGGINISDAFLMLFGFSEVGAIANISDAFLMHFGFLFTGLKKKLNTPLQEV